MKELGIWEAYAVKVQSIKTAVESAAMLLSIDDIVLGSLAEEPGGGWNRHRCRAHRRRR